LFVYPEYYQKDPFSIFVPQVGGKTLVGGVLLGYFAVLLAKRILKFKRSVGDLFAPALAIGIAVGRLGCFFNGCCYGKETKSIFGIIYGGVNRYPTQLYESIFCFGLFLILWKIRTKVVREGDLFKLFLLFYGFFRFWVEFLRADAVSAILGLSIAQIISAVVFLTVAIYFWRKKYV
jgi:phosphatidylglycerol:prolipoprotein diacylglycerol transferase